MLSLLLPSEKWNPFILNVFSVTRQWLMLSLFWGLVLRMHDNHDNGSMEFKLFLLTFKALYNIDLANVEGLISPLCKALFQENELLTSLPNPCSVSALRSSGTPFLPSCLAVLSIEDHLKCHLPHNISRLWTFFSTLTKVLWRYKLHVLHNMNDRAYTSSLFLFFPECQVVAGNYHPARDYIGQ